jgi:hypothetical protein
MQEMGFNKKRRKSPCFSYGDIRRILTYIDYAGIMICMVGTSTISLGDVRREFVPAIAA